MLNLIKQNAGLAISLGIGLVFVAAGFWKHRNPSPPEKWRKVGTLSNLWCYPIKSCKAISMESADCVVLGLKQNYMRDRIFMITGTDKKFKTARMYPHMTLIETMILNDTMVLCAPGMAEVVKIEISSLSDLPKTRATVWEHEVDTVDCGDEVAKWLSQYILKQDVGLRLVFYPNALPSRSVREKNTFSKITSNDTGAFPDATSFMLINEASVKDLATKLPEDCSCTPMHFRPNFVVSGSELQPYEEDDWQWLRIGDSAIFKCVKPCTRCVFTNIDPETGIPNKAQQPLKALKGYRKIADPNLKAYVGDSPVMGVHLGVYQEGTVALGDAVYVGV